MKKLVLDIETIPADVSVPKTREALEYLYNRKIEKKMRDKNVTRDEAILDFGDFDSFVNTTGLDGSFGRVLCIAYAVNSDPVRVICHPDNEAKTLADFWHVAGQCDLFIGHNVMDFDLRFILQRSIVLGVKPSWNRFQELGKKPWDMVKYLSFSRYSNLPIFDTMQEWGNWGSAKVGLEHIALALGIPTPKVGIDGSEVWQFFKDGKVTEICDYCARDVETTRAVYERITMTGGLKQNDLFVDYSDPF